MVPIQEFRNKSFAAQEKSPLRVQAISDNLARLFGSAHRGELALRQISSEIETAGALEIREEKGKLYVSGMRVFGNNETRGTAESVVISSKLYADLKGAFIPFHTHLGHPATFKGLARFAPTAEDVFGHRELMRSLAKTHGTSLKLPGVIIHATGELTFFWVGENDDEPVVVRVISPSGRSEMGSVYVSQLEAAEVTGELALGLAPGIWLIHPEHNPFGEIITNYLWDPKRFSRRLEIFMTI